MKFKGVNNNKVFIIIVTYNGMKWLPECLESTIPYTVVVVDNFSSDGTQHYIKKNYPNVILLEQSLNLGFGKANNIGISYALRQGADFVFLLNQDAFLEQNTLQELLKVSIKNPEYGVISPVHLNELGNGLEEVFQYYIKKDSINSLITDLILKKELKEVYEVQMINAAAWLVPKKTLDIVGGFHPMFFLYGEDDNYCQRVRFHKFKIGFSPNVFIRHDSTITYHLEPEIINEKFLQKYKNRILVEYADVNMQNDGRLKKLKINLLRGGIKSLLLLNFKDFKINLKKYSLIKELDFSLDKKELRKNRRHFLENPA